MPLLSYIQYNKDWNLVCAFGGGYWRWALELYPVQQGLKLATPGLSKDPALLLSYIQYNKDWNDVGDDMFQYMDRLLSYIQYNKDWNSLLNES